jgi:hypothetical protein
LNHLRTPKVVALKLGRKKQREDDKKEAIDCLGAVGIITTTRYLGIIQILITSPTMATY